MPGRPIFPQGTFDATFPWDNYAYINLKRPHRPALYGVGQTQVFLAPGQYA